MYFELNSTISVLTHAGLLQLTSEKNHRISQVPCECVTFLTDFSNCYPFLCICIKSKDSLCLDIPVFLFAVPSEANVSRAAAETRLHDGASAARDTTVPLKITLTQVCLQGTAHIYHIYTRLLHISL